MTQSTTAEEQLSGFQVDKISSLYELLWAYASASHRDSKHASITFPHTPHGRFAVTLFARKSVGALS